MSNHNYNCTTYGFLLADKELNDYLNKLNDASEEYIGRVELTDFGFDGIDSEDEDKTFAQMLEDGSFHDWKDFDEGIVVPINPPTYFNSPYKNIDDMVEDIVNQFWEADLLIPNREYIKSHIGEVRWVSYG